MEPQKRQATCPWSNCSPLQCRERGLVLHNPGVEVFHMLLLTTLKFNKFPPSLPATSAKTHSLTMPAS